MLEWVLLLIIGVGTGAYGVLVGAGGGFILSPILLSFFGLSPSIVAGTSLALVAINTISAAFTYWRMGFIDRRSGILFAIAAIPGAVIAPFFISRISVGIFQILMGILLLIVSGQIAWKDRSGSRVIIENVTAMRKEKSGVRRNFMMVDRNINTTSGRIFRYSFNEIGATAFNLILGFISSFFGTGGGFLRTPILINVFKFPVEVAVATSIFALAFITTAGSVSHIALGNVEWWPTFVFAGAGLIIGGQIGARLTGKINSKWVLRMLLVVLVAIGVRLLLQGFNVV